MAGRVPPTSPAAGTQDLGQTSRSRARGGYGALWHGQKDSTACHPGRAGTVRTGRGLPAFRRHAPSYIEARAHGVCRRVDYCQRNPQPGRSSTTAAWFASSPSLRRRCSRGTLRCLAGDYHVVATDVSATSISTSYLNERCSAGAAREPINCCAGRTDSLQHLNPGEAITPTGLLPQPLARRRRPAHHHFCRTILRRAAEAAGVDSTFSRARPERPRATWTRCATEASRDRRRKH